MNSTVLYNIFWVTMLVQFAFSFCTFILLFFVNAPYGKHVSKKFGPTINAKVGWVLMEMPAFLVIILFYFIALFSGHYNDGRSVVVMTVFILIWELHYIHRTFVYPFLLHKKSKPMAVLIPLFGMIFNTMNGFINGFYLFSGKTIIFEGTFFQIDLSHMYTIQWLYDPRFIVGLMIFMSGFLINIHSDHVLRTLRAPGETGYKVPNKGVHRLVASPNYFGEFLEWSGWALLTWSAPGIAFAVFTFANLAPRAWSNRKWYRSQFGEEYPSKRKAIIPFFF